MKITLTTMVVVFDRPNNRILMQNRKKRWKGYAPPGGHVEFPESITACAVREVKEETGIDVFDLQYKGLLHWVNENTQERYMVYNYYTESFSGELCDENEEGTPEWVDLNRLREIKLSEGMEGRLEEMFFIPGVVEVHIIWNEEGKREKTVHRI